VSPHRWLLVSLQVVIADLDSGQVRLTPPHDDRDDDENFDELPRGVIPDLPDPEASELRTTLEVPLVYQEHTLCAAA